MPVSEISAYTLSPSVSSSEIEKEILSRASLTQLDDEAVNHMRVLVLKGTPYEMGFQHGRLLREDARKAIGRLYERVAHYVDPVILDDIFAQIAPYISIEDQQEMLGLAHGADIPIRIINRFHAIPELSEYRDKKKFLRDKLLPTSCSNIAVLSGRSEDREIFHTRILDWMRELGIQEFPLVTVYDYGNAKAVNFGYAGFVGSITGMNSYGISLGEMGYGDAPEETFEGKPFVFLFKDLLRRARSLEDVVEYVRNVPRTCSYAYVASSATENDAVLIVSNRDEFRTYRQNVALVDAESHYPAIENVVYAGAKDEALYESLSSHASHSVETIKEVAKAVALSSNMQIVIMRPKSMEAWVANAAGSSLRNANDESGKACNQAYFHFKLSDYGK